MPVADAAHCERAVRDHARTFALASRFLPESKRRATFALYAFCRAADDIVDAGQARHDGAVARRLAELGRQLGEALAGRPTTPLFRELAWAVREYDVPAAALHELLDGVARDLRPARYGSWPELARYCEGVASSVGEMCTHVFGVPGDGAARRSALRYARALGVAMQLTNILRDVGEDARAGRCYLPDDDLARFGLDAERVLSAARTAWSDGGRGTTLARDDRWRALMAFEIERARAIYATAMPGIALLAPDTRRCASACAWGYAAILGAIERNGYDTITRRACVTGWARVGVLWDAWRGKGTALASDDVVARTAPAPQWEASASDTHTDLVKWA